MPRNLYNNEANELPLLKFHKSRFWFSIRCGFQDEGYTCSVKLAAGFHTSYTLEWPAEAENPPTRVEGKCEAFDSIGPGSISDVLTIPFWCGTYRIVLISTNSVQSISDHYWKPNILYVLNMVFLVKCNKQKMTHNSFSWELVWIDLKEVYNTILIFSNKRATDGERLVSSPCKFKRKMCCCHCHTLDQ